MVSIAGSHFGMFWEFFSRSFGSSRVDCRLGRGGSTGSLRVDPAWGRLRGGFELLWGSRGIV